uniref:peptidoglycan-binding domain-containing protein n=1 Tax=Hyphococcus sp. TaxID=2038636 RepID=UPI0035C6669E
VPIGHADRASGSASASIIGCTDDWFGSWTGYDAGSPDGIMGSRTRNAIIEFQKANGLLPSGEVDRALVDKLLEVNKQS